MLFIPQLLPLTFCMLKGKEQNFRNALGCNMKVGNFEVCFLELFSSCLVDVAKMSSKMIRNCFSLF